MPSEKYNPTVQQVKKLISSVLISNPSRYIPVVEFENDYRDLIGSPIPYTKLGFSSLKEFFLSIPDVLEMKSKNGVVVIVPFVNKKVAHIKDMINKQKKSTSRKKQALAFIPPSVRNRKTVDQPHGERGYQFSSQSDNGPTHDLKSGASKKDSFDVHKRGNKSETKEQDSTRVMRKPEEARHDITKCNPSSVKDRLTAAVVDKKLVEKKSDNKPGCSRDVKNRSESYKNHPHGEQRHHIPSQSGNRSTRDLKLKKDLSDVNKLGYQGERKERDSTRVMRKPEEARSDVVKCNSHSVKERLIVRVVNEKPLDRKLQDKPSCSREVQNRKAQNGTKLPVSEKKNYIQEIVTEGIIIKEEPTSDDSSVRANAVVQKETKRLVSEKTNCTREIVKHSKIRTEDIAIKTARTKKKPDNTTLKILQGIKRRIETYEQYMARKGSSTEKEKAKSKERGRSTKKKSESGSSSSDSSRSSSESSSSSGSKSSSSSSSGSSSRSSSSSSDSSSSRNRNRTRTKQRSQSKTRSTRKSVDKDKKEKVKEKENDVNRDKEKDAKSKTASVSDKKSDAKHRSRSRSRSSHRKKRHRSPTPRPTKIHIGRLTRTVNREHIYEIFGAYGVIKNVEFPKDHVHSHIGRGYAYVEYSNADEAEDAMKHMDGGQIDGQEITAAPVLIPKPRPYMPRRSPMPMRRLPMRRPPPHFRRRSPLRPPRRSPPRRRPRSRNSPAKRRKRSRSSSSSSR